MGFIASSTTVNIIAYLTQAGREYLVENKAKFNINYFALGDSDTNYFVLNNLESGFVPDLTGNSDDCIPSISSNIDIKNKIIQE